MSIPQFNDLFLPTLKQFGDKGNHTANEIASRLADALGLSEDDRNEMYPTGSGTVLTGRVSWVVRYLIHAGLLERTKKGVYAITERGLSLLAENPPSLSPQELESRYPEVNYSGPRTRAGGRSGKKSSAEPEAIKVDIGDATPDELLEASYRRLHTTLVNDVLESVNRTEPAQFEQLVIDLLLAMGYGGSFREAGQALGRSGDGGIDGIIKEDRLGLDVIYLQAKRWRENKVGRPEIQQFAGALQGRRAKKGVFITTSEFTNEAREFAKALDNKLILIDGRELADLMIEHGVGVTIRNTLHIKRLDTDYFEME